MVEARVCLELKIMEVIGSCKGVLKRSNYVIACDVEQVQQKPGKNQSKTKSCGENCGTEEP